MSEYVWHHESGTYSLALAHGLVEHHHPGCTKEVHMAQKKPTAFWSATRDLMKHSPMIFVTVVIGIVAAILWNVGTPWKGTISLFNPLVWQKSTLQAICVLVFVLLTLFTFVDELFGIQLDGIIPSMMHGKIGADVLAVIALVATVGCQQYWAAWILDLMVYSGDTIETFAQIRARRNLTKLLDAAPQVAHVLNSSAQQTSEQDATNNTERPFHPTDHDANQHDVRTAMPSSSVASSEWTTVPVDQVKVGDEIIVRPGETLPVNGTLESDRATIDMSMINGEPVPVDAFTGDQLSSGAINGASALRMRATATAGNSQYQRILDLVRSAENSRADVVKTADMLAVPFTIISLVIALFALVCTWITMGFGEGMLRFTQVLVLATPCPLLIAAPVAYMGGTGRLARSGIIIKTQDILENLGRVSHIFFDKTGTLTYKRPDVERVDVSPWARTQHYTSTSILSVAGPLEAYSVHILAKGITKAGDAVLRTMKVARPHVTHPHEDSGNGIEGLVSGHTIRIGRLAYVCGHDEETDALRQKARTDFGSDLSATQMCTYVSFDGHLAARIVLRDFARKNSAQTIRDLHNLGITRLTMLTGDKMESAQAIASEIGIDDVKASLLPEQKVAAVKAAQSETGYRDAWINRFLRKINRQPEVQPITMMVGDGVNDAPTLASANIGVAMTDGSTTAASESSQVVIMNDNIEMVPRAIRVSRQTKRTMLQATCLGLGLAIIAMVLAACNIIPIVVGAILQEVIDLCSILWGLTALADKKDKKEKDTSNR
jgi:heavy metal translocating P-type ATPase